ncbi:MAG: hypothetical protein WC679_01465 [Bacteroidales bacterium]|jgi:hypothetical protein
MEKYIFTEEEPKKAYIIPRAKPKKGKPKETQLEELCRRLEEYIEFAHACKRFEKVAFFEEILQFIEVDDCKNKSIAIYLLREIAIQIIHSEFIRCFSNVGFYQELFVYIDKKCDLKRTEQLLFGFAQLEKMRNETVHI